MRKLFEVYFMNDEALTEDGPVRKWTAHRRDARQNMTSFAADFGHGIIAKSSIDALHQEFAVSGGQHAETVRILGFNLITRYERAD